MPEGETGVQKLRRLVTWINQRADWLALGIVLLAFLAGMVYALLLGDQLRFIPDEPDYLTLSENWLAQGRYSLDGIHPTAYRPPGYPFLLMWVRALGFGLFEPGVFLLRLANFALLALTWLLLYRLVRQMHSPLVALLALLMAGGYVVLFYTAGTFYPQTLAAFLLLVVIWSVNQKKQGDRISPLRALGIGLVAGWLGLTLPTFLFVLPVLLVWWVITHRDWRMAVLAVAVVLLLVGAWTVRNYVAFESWVFIATNGGENLLLGNSLETTANAGTLVDISTYRQQVEALGLDEVERDAYFRSQALETMRAHPAETLRLYFEKFLNYFNYRNQLATQSEASPLRDLAMLLTYLPILGMGLLRVGSGCRRLHRTEVLLAALYLAGALVQAVFFTRIRFRLPYDYCLIVLAAGWLGQFIPFRKGISYEE